MSDDPQVEAVGEILAPVSKGAIVPRELGLVLAKYPEINAELEALRLVQWAERKDERLTYPISALDRWLEKSREFIKERNHKPKKRKAAGPLSEEQIQNRLEHRRDLYGRMMEWKGAAYSSEYAPVLSEAKLNEEIAEYEADLRSGRAR